MKIGDKIQCEDNVMFEITKELKSGGQGSVYVVRKNNSNQLYALKIINEKNNDRKQAKINNIRILHQETSRLLGLLENKPYKIALPLSIYSENGDFGYVMNLCSGKDIGDLMIKNRFDSMPLEDRLNIVYKISEAAHFLRTNGYCYQDFSHGNFMYDEVTNKVISVIDVDNITASSDAAAGRTNFVKGTTFYTAPEIAFGQCNPSIESDNFALATLFYKIMTGSTHSPYHGKVLYSKSVMPATMEDAAYYAQDDPDEFGIDWLTFVFDPTNKSNVIELNKGNADFVAEGKKVISNWELVPKDMKEFFYRAFKNPLDAGTRKTRPSSSDWMRLIKKLLSNTPPIPHSPQPGQIAPTNGSSTSSKLQIYVELPNKTKVTIDSEQTIKTTRGITLGIIKPAENKVKFISKCIYGITSRLENDYKNLNLGDEIELKEKMEVYITTSYSEKIKVISIK